MWCMLRWQQVGPRLPYGCAHRLLVSGSGLPCISLRLLSTETKWASLETAVFEEAQVCHLGIFPGSKKLVVATDKNEVAALDSQTG